MTYVKDIRPILQARCIVCHNQSVVDNAAVSGGLALDSYAALTTGVVGKSGATPIFTPGKSAASGLMKRLIATSPAKMMPRGGPPLPPEQIALFKRWIDAGASAGDQAKEAKPAHPGIVAAPMPADPGLQEVAFPTRISLSPELLPKNAPKDAALSLALKVGPLPPVTALAYSPDGKRLAVGAYRAVVVWDTAKGQPVGSLTGLAGAVMSVAFRPDGGQIAVASGAPGASGEVRIYDAQTFAQAGPALSGHADVVTGVAWSPNGTRIATASQDKTARIWEWPSGKELKVLRDNADAVTRVVFAPDGKSVYTASLDRNLRRFDVAAGTVQRVFSGHDNIVTALALSPDGRGLVSSGPERRLRWWNPDDGNTTRFSDGSGGQVNDIVFSKDGKLMASAAEDQRVRIWDAGNGGQQRELIGCGDWVYSVALSPDGKFAAGGGGDGVTRIWEAANGRLRLALAVWPASGKSAAPEWAALTPEGFFDGSPAWTKKLRALIAGQPAGKSLPAAFAQSLCRPENELKAWQGAALEPAKLPVVSVSKEKSPAPTVKPAK